MQSQNHLLADLAKLANSAAGTLAGVSREVRGSVQRRRNEQFGGADFVSRDEFDAVKAMAAKAREENDALEKRIAELEAQLKK